MSKPKAVALFGGTFDPVHIGHLRMAIELRQTLQLDVIRMLPCATPYHRDQPALTANQRLAMLKLATDGNSHLSIDERELHRSGPSYTVDSLLEIRKEVGGKTPITLCIGMDSLEGFARWHCWASIPELAHIVVVGRPGYKPPTKGPVAEMLQQRTVQNSQALQQTPCGKVLIQQMTLLPVSATQIRANIQQGLSIKYLVPEAVEHYIQHHKLYIKQEGIQ